MEKLIPIYKLLHLHSPLSKFFYPHRETHFARMGYFNRHHKFQFLIHASFIISTIPLCVSEIKNIHIVDDSRPMILFERFGFAQGGHVTISVEDISWRKSNNQMNSELKPSSMGFFIVREASFAQILNESESTNNFCVLSSHYVRLIFNFDHTTYNGSIVVDEPDEYSVVFGNCQPDFAISMNVHTEMYNLVQDGTTKDFLPAGQTPLPKLYFFFFILYSCFLGIWVFLCMKQKPSVSKVHLIMGALLIFKALKVLCASEDKMYVKRTGTPHGWDVAFYVFGFLKGIMLFTVIILIGTGWSFLKPYLQDREKKVLMIVIPLQVLENIAYIVISETSPATKAWLTWNQMFLVIDIACCCAVFFPIIWSIRSLRQDSKTDGKVAKNVVKPTLFKQFYVVVVVYLYFTRVGVSALGAIVSYKYEWVMTAASEGASLAFYMFIFYNFQPVEKNPYFEIHDHEDEDEDEDVELARKLEDDESFEL